MNGRKERQNKNDRKIKTKNKSSLHNYILNKDINLNGVEFNDSYNYV